MREQHSPHFLSILFLCPPGEGKRKAEGVSFCDRMSAARLDYTHGDLMRVREDDPLSDDEEEGMVGLILQRDNAGEHRCVFLRVLLLHFRSCTGTKRWDTSKQQAIH